MVAVEMTLPAVIRAMVLVVWERTLAAEIDYRSSLLIDKKVPHTLHRGPAPRKGCDAPIKEFSSLTLI